MRKFLSIQRVALGLVLLCLAILVKGQSTVPTVGIGWPQDGAVFQQEANGKGNISVLGIFNSKAWRIFGDRSFVVTAKLEKLKVSTGEPFPNAPSITITPTRYSGGLLGGVFANVDRGWYRLTLQAVGTGFFISPLPTLVYTSSIKVGVGDVFIISGQSNAQGLPNRPNNGVYPNWDKVANQKPTYDGVRVVTSYFTEADRAAVVPTDFFSRWGVLSNLTSVGNAANSLNSGIAPAGPSLWYWARVGELISQRYGNDEVPV